MGPRTASDDLPHRICKDVGPRSIVRAFVYYAGGHSSFANAHLNPVVFHRQLHDIPLADHELHLVLPPSVKKMYVLTQHRSEYVECEVESNLSHFFVHTCYCWEQDRLWAAHSSSSLSKWWMDHPSRRQRSSKCACFDSQVCLSLSCESPSSNRFVCLLQRPAHQRVPRYPGFLLLAAQHCRQVRNLCTACMSGVTRLTV